MDDASRGGRLFFIDSENGFERLIEGCENLNPNDLVVVFFRGSVPKQVRLSLEFSPAQVEWITCVDPGIKNSMDFQIVADLALRLTLSGFDEGYVVSCDKGFNPALHYLKQQSVARGSELLLVPSISHAVVHSVTRALWQLAQLDSRQAIEHAFSLLLGRQDAEKLVDRISEVLVREALEQERFLEEARAASEDDDEAAAAGDRAQDEQPEVRECIEKAEKSSRDTETLEQQCSPKHSEETLADLKGVGKALSRKLKEVGISTPDQLRAAGSVEAWRRIRERDVSFPLRWLYMFEVAITGGSLGDIGSERKQQLKKEAKRAS